MENFTSTIIDSSFEMTARERIKFKDLTDAIKLDKETSENGSLKLTIANFAILQIHNGKSKNNPDYKNYMYIDEEGKKYVSGSESLWNAFKDIYDELHADGDTEPITLIFYRVPSKNYAGKDFLTCSLA